MTHINISDIFVLILAGATLLTSAANYHLSNENQTEKIENRFNIVVFILEAILVIRDWKHFD